MRIPNPILCPVPPSTPHPIQRSAQLASPANLNSSGVARFAGGTVAISIFSTILANVQGQSAAELVPPAATAAGLPEGSVSALLAALPLGAAALEQVPGITKEVIAAAGAAFQQSYVVGLRTTALSSLSFGIIAIIGEFRTAYAHSDSLEEEIMRANA